MVPADCLARASLVGTPAWTAAYRWQEGSGYTALVDIASDPFSKGHGVQRISHDGSAVAGIGLDDANNRKVFYWTQDTGMLVVGGIGADAMSTVGELSADGSVIVGWSQPTAADSNRAFRWSLATGVQPLAVPDGTVSSRAKGVDATGSIVWETQARWAPRCGRRPDP